eukprot:2945087-Rhodomonas_salina.1
MLRQTSKEARQAVNNSGSRNLPFPFAFAVRCPVLMQVLSLPGDRAGAAAQVCDSGEEGEAVQGKLRCLCACHAMLSTDAAHGGARQRTSGTRSSSE